MVGREAPPRPRRYGYCTGWPAAAPGPFSAALPLQLGPPAPPRWRRWERQFRQPSLSPEGASAVSAPWGQRTSVSHLPHRPSSAKSGPSRSASAYGPKRASPATQSCHICLHRAALMATRCRHLLQAACWVPWFSASWCLCASVQPRMNLPAAPAGKSSQAARSRAFGTMSRSCASSGVRRTKLLTPLARAGSSSEIGPLGKEGGAPAG